MWNSIIDNLIGYLKSYQGMFGVDIDKGADHRKITDICPAIRVLRTNEGSEHVGLSNPDERERSISIRIWCFDKADAKDFKASDAYNQIALLEKKLKEGLCAWAWDRSKNSGDFEDFQYTVEITRSGFNEMSFLPAVGSFFDIDIDYLKG